jgi:hypothetical protein
LKDEIEKIITFTKELRKKIKATRDKLKNIIPSI